MREPLGVNAMKYIKIALWIAAGLLCLQFITYFTLSNRFLTHVAMRCRPESMRRSDAHYKWVCLTNVNTKEVDPDLAQRIKDAFEERYEKVYYKKRDIPKDLIAYRTVGRKQGLVSYNGGYEYRITFRDPGFMNIIVSHHDYRGNMASYGRQGWYFWMLFWWVRVHTCYSMIS